MALRDSRHDQGAHPPRIASLTATLPSVGGADFVRRGPLSRLATIAAVTTSREVVERALDLPREEYALAWATARGPCGLKSTQLVRNVSFVCPSIAVHRT